MKRFAVLLAAGVAAAGLAQTALPTGVDQTAIDRSAKPGDSFNRYANGAWIDRAEIPADRSSVGVFQDVGNVAEGQNAAIIQGAAADRAATGDARRIADYYAAYADTAGIEARGLAPVQGELAAIAALPDKAALARMLGANIRVDVDPLNASSFWTQNLFGLWVTQSLNDPSRTVPYVLQGGLGIQDRDYYLADTPENREIREAYLAYADKVLGLAGLSDPAARAARVLALETKIARAHADIVAAEDVHKANNPWQRADFARRAPGIDWTAFWAAAGLPRQQDFIVWEPAAIAGEAALIRSESLDSWKDWLVFHRLNQVAAVLPRAFDDASFAFYGKQLQGTQAPRPRDKRAIAAVNAAMGDAVGRLYVQRYFPPSSKADIQAMTRNVLAAFDKRVAALDWMAPATKAEARRKIETLRVGVGYPERWRDYATLEVRRDDAVGNLRRAQLLETRHQLAKLGRSVDRGEWWMTPQTVNAVNLPLQNALNFPAAILQAPFYDAHRDAAANYGGIGATIGHEVSHSFDNTGADFDADGRLRNWWTPADLQHFDAAGAALAAQYDAYEALPGVHLKGQQTLGENIADLAGLTAALDAYHASLGGRPAPVIDGLTGDQRLFLAFATTWRAKMRERALRAQIATNGHAPAAWRAETVRNLDAWYQAFGVRPGDKLYLAPAQRVRVW